MMFDCVVIGNGLAGSAAAKYVQSMGLNTALVGKPEMPESDIYASHYDEGRILRQIGKDKHRTALNLFSIKQYPHIENQSGIKFYYPEGCLYINPHEEDEYLSSCEQEQKANHSIGNKISVRELNHLYPLMKFPEESHIWFEPSPSGYINPRKLKEAQQKILVDVGGVLVNDIAVEVQSHHQNHVTIKLKKGNIIQSKKVILAAGVYANCFNLIPNHLKLSLTIKGESVLMAEVDVTTANLLAHYPSVLYEINNASLDGIYFTKPLQYPDGRYYIKMGCNFPTDNFFNTYEEIQYWFNHGDSDKHLPEFIFAFQQIFPSLAVEQFFTKRCIIARTNHQNAYIGQLPNLPMYVVGGCNGYSAMNSDALGYIAANLCVHNQFPSPFNADAFALVFKS